MLKGWAALGSFQGWILRCLFVGAACFFINCSGGSSGTEAPGQPPLQPDPVNYLAELKIHLNTYRSAIKSEIDTGDVAVYYATSYYLHGLAAGAEATGDTEVMDELLGFIDQLMAHAKPLVRNGVTYKAWGPWDVNGNPQQLNTFQAMGPLARTAAIIAARPEFKTRYGAKADQIVAFVDQAIFKYWFDKAAGYYSDPKGPWLGGQIPWLPVSLGGWGSYAVWDDKCSHVGMISTWVYQATRNPLYQDYATRVAKGFRTHVTVRNGSWIWDLGIVPIEAGENQEGTPDTSHANREPMMLVSMYEAGIEIQKPDIEAVASTFTQIIWNQRSDDPMFSNYINGSNKMYRAANAWENGIVYHGWDMLGRHSSEAQRVLALSYQYIRTRRPLNPSLASNASRYGLMELSGTLARNVAP